MTDFVTDSTHTSATLWLSREQHLMDRDNIKVDLQRKHVRILDINEKAGNKLEKELNEKFGANRVKFVECDVTNDKQLFAAIIDTKVDMGYLDLLVNNAGSANENDYATIRKQIELNYIAVVNGTLKAIEIMDKNKGGKGGTVLNIASIAGLCPVCPPLFSYCATKSALLQFTECIGDKTHFDNGVRVIALCYGVTDTAIFDSMNGFNGNTQAAADIMGQYKTQSALSAAKGTIDAYKKGESASVWLIQNDLEAIDISEDRQKCHEAMLKLINS